MASSRESKNRVDDLVADALEVPPERRREFLDEACQGDESLRTEVEALLSVPSTTLNRVEHPAFELLPRPSRAAPSTVGPYRLETKLGEGGTSEVFKARRMDGSDDRAVAIKLLKRGMDSDEILRRFEREGRILSALRHPGIARVFGGGLSADHRPYLVLELIRGRPIDRAADAARADTRQRVRWVRRACEAVAHAHRNLVIHRDLKPDNILIDDAGHLKILDFGLSKLLDPQSAETVSRTAAGHRMLTPEYAAPEQLTMADCTTAVDVYALGVVLFELLTGQRPFGGSDDPTGFLRRVLEDDPPTPSSLRQGLSPDLDAIVSKAIRKAPDERYLSVEELGLDLDNFLAHRPIKARNGGLFYGTMKFLRRRRREVAFGLLLAGGLGLVVAERETSRRRLAEERNRAVAVQDLMIDLFSDLDPYLRAGAGPPSLEALLERGLEETRRLEGVPILKATLLQSLGRLYGNRGRLEESFTVIEEAVQLYETSLPSDDPRRPASLTLLGDVLALSGQSEEAERVLSDALAEWQALPEVRTSDLAPTQVSLARARAGLGQTEEARSLYIETLTAIDAQANQDPALRSLQIEIAMLLGNLLLNEGDSDRALVFLDTSWRQAAALWSENDARSLFARGLWARELFRSGHHREALDHLAFVAEETWAVLGDHPHTGTAFYRWGLSLAETGEPARAREVLTEAKGLYARTRGAESEGALACADALRALDDS